MMLEIWALGGLKLSKNGRPVTGLASRKAEALVLYLLRMGQAHTREKLATLLWLDYPAERALNNLSVLLTSLRKQLNEYLLINRQTVGFNFNSPHWLDTVDLEQRLKPLLATARTEEVLGRPAMKEVETALELYQGDFLANFHVLHAQGFEEWALLERERLRRQVIKALDILAASCLAWDSQQAGLRAAQRLLALDPLRERTHRQLMRLYVQSNQRSAALKQYEDCRQILQAELGVEPVEETVLLYEKIQTTRSLRRHNLPTSLTPFVGRQKEREDIAARLAYPSCRLLTLLGPGGVGKTRLALEVAEAQVGRYLQGVFFIPLTSGVSLTTALADAMEIPLSGRESPKEQLLDHLREKETLLLLDGFEPFISETPFLAELLQGAPEVRLLVTSRQRLSLQAEWVLELAGLDVPETAAVADTTTSGAVQLFVQSARRVGLPAKHLQEQLPDVVDICRLVDGLPLAIELAASWTRALDCREIAAEIRRGVDFLTSTSSDLPERHRSLRAVFEHSWRLLAPEEQVMFSRLTIFPGDFGRLAAGEVAHVPLPILSALVDKSLLGRRAPTATGSISRYEMHDLLRAFGVERLAGRSGESGDLHARHGRYYAKFLQGQAASLKGAEPTPALSRITLELDNVRQAWHWAASSGSESELEKMVEPLYRFLWIRGRYQEGYELFLAAVRNLAEAFGEDRQEGKRIGAMVLARLAWFCIRTGRLEEAREKSEQSLELARSLQADPETAFALLTLGQACHLLGNYLKASKLYDESLIIGRTLDNQEIIAACLGSVMRLSLLQGEFDDARAALEESEAIIRQLGDRWKLALSLHNAGIFGMRVGDYEQAQAAYLEGLEIVQELKSQRETAAFLHNMGVMAHRQGKFDQARSYYSQALDIFRDVGDRRAIAAALGNLGEVAEFSGYFIEAERRHQASLALCYEIGEQPRIANSLNALGHLALRQGANNEAARYFQEALELAWQVSAILIVLEVIVGIAGLWARQGDVAQCVELLAFVLAHPTTAPETKKNRAEPLMAELTAGLALEQVAKAEARGRNWSLEEVISEVLDAFGHADLLS